MEEKNKIKGEEFSWMVRVRLETHLDPWIKDNFEGIELIHEDGGNTLITGRFQDMAAVYGLI